MGRQNVAQLSFNRGEVSKIALARVDVERLRLSAETQCNWQPTVLGPMMLRPGLQYVGGIRSDLENRLLPFVFGTNDVALLECTNLGLRIWNVDGDTETLVTRPAVTSVVTNGDFSSSTGWTTTATGTGAVASIAGGVLTLASPATGGLAQAKRSVTIVETGIEHALRIAVTRGPVLFRCGTTDGDDDLIAETTLDTGTHSLAFTTASATVYVQLENRSAQSRIVDSITFESSGVLTLPTTWATADLRRLRYYGSGDIIYVACNGQQQHKIERRSTRSWSFVLYKSDDGPFSPANFTDTTLTPSVLTGNGTLTASRPLFRSTHVGALFRLFSSGQTISANLSAQNTFTDAIRVTGVDAVRIFSYAITGTWAGTLTLQRSFDSATTGFSDVTTFTSNTSTTYDDTLDNSIVWYRIGFKTGAYTSGTASITLIYAGGSAAGVCRIVGYTSRTVVDIEVLDAFSSLTATTDWNEGEWSDRLGWPSAVAFHDGRLWWAGRDKIWGSVSDAYTSFNPDTEGDSGPINRSVGFGPIDTINWLLPLTRLVVGREGAETSVRSGSQDEPLSPTNFTLKDCSTQGSSNVEALKIDTRGVFLQASGRRVYELAFSAEALDYVAHDLTRLNPDIGVLGFTGMAVQRQPDTQMHFVRADGQVCALVHDVGDEVACWWRIDTECGVAGAVEDVVVLPGALENRVYYSVKRVIGGVTKRFLEKQALRSQCDGAPQARCADSHVIYTGGGTAVSGLSHLEGQGVVAWGWNDDGSQGYDCGTGLDAAGVMQKLTVTGGAITIPTGYDNVCVGLPYVAQFKSAKLAYAAQMGTALNQKKKINRIGLMLSDTHQRGIRFGQSFTRMDNLPMVKDGADVPVDTIHVDFDGPMFPMPGDWGTDSRLCLMAASPRPAMPMSVVTDITTNETP
jgi:hypothetical protein